MFHYQSCFGVAALVDAPPPRPGMQTKGQSTCPQRRPIGKRELQKHLPLFLLPLTDDHSERIVGRVLWADIRNGNFVTIRALCQESLLKKCPKLSLSYDLGEDGTIVRVNHIAVVTCGLAAFDTFLRPGWSSA